MWTAAASSTRDICGKRAKKVNSAENENSAQVPKTLQRGGNYQRVVDAGREIGIDAITGMPTTKFTIITNKAGDLLTAFPGLPGR